MRMGLRNASVPWCGRVKLAIAVVLAVAVTTFTTRAQAPSEQAPSLDELLSGVVRIKTSIDPDGRTVRTLGRARDGSGIVIDENGHVLTIGYLMVEAQTAELLTNDGRTVPALVLGYDHASGFGLLKAVAPLKVTPFTFGKSADLKEREPVLAASYGGRGGLAPAYVVSRREFAGSWEYLLDSAIYTAPAHSHWSGAALINRNGKLVGVGSLVLADVSGSGKGVAGNMYVPIDLLPPILSSLMADKPPDKPAQPWLGISTEEVAGRLFVSRVTSGGPAEKAGIQRGDILLGVDGQPAKSLADFYRKVWAKGPAGVTVPIDVLQDNEKRRVEIKSMNRHDHLRLKSTL